MRHADADDRVSHLVITYLLVLPLIIFSAQSGFSFQAIDQNTELAGGTLGLVSDSDTASYRVLTVIVAAATLMLVVFSRRGLSKVMSRSKILLLPPIWAMLSSIWSNNPLLSLRRGVFLMIGTLFALSLVGRMRPGQLLRLLVIVGVCDSVASLFLIFFMPGIGVFHQDSSGAWRGLFAHKNLYGIPMVYFLSCALYAKPPRAFGKLYRYTLMALFSLQIIGSQARTAWLLAVELLLVAGGLSVAKQFRKKDILSLSPALLGLLALAIPLLSSSLPILFEAIGKDATLTGRTDIWAAVLGFIFRRPILGYGYNAFWTGMQGDSAAIAYQVGWEAPHAHSGFLEVWLELGGVGLGILLMIFYKAFRDALTCFSSDAPAHVNWFIAVISVTFVCNIDEPNFFVALSLPWMLVVICCSGLAQEAEKVRKQRRQESIAIEVKDVLASQ